MNDTIDKLRRNFATGMTSARISDDEWRDVFLPVIEKAATARTIEGTYEYSPTLQCTWQRIECMGPMSIAIHLAAHNCCDMRGAVTVATLIMPDVEVIQTYQGGNPDTAYQKLGDSWAACATLNQQETT